MPQENMTSRLGTSKSPVVARVIDNSKNGQQPVAVPGVIKNGQFNRKPVKIG